jgi:hypothetical protein
MDSGQTVYILLQLVFGAAATFLAIMLWPKIRDVAWMLIIVGTIVSYIEIVYSILSVFGVSDLPLVSYILPTVKMAFFIAAFAVMIVRQSRQN